MTMPDLTRFLLARISEDEQSARLARSAAWLAVANEAASVDYNAGWHILNQDPDRTVREASAKRLTVERLADSDLPEVHADVWEWSKWVLRMMAVPYANHPDYRDEWKP